GQSYVGGTVTYNWYAVPDAGSGLTAINNPIVQVNPTEPGDYQYFFFATVDGCTSDTAVWSVNVQAPPALSLSVDGNLECVTGADSIQLMASGQASTWFWEGLNTGFISNEQNPIIPNATAANSDTYVLTATTSNGCVSTASISIDITDQPPAPTLIASDTALCLGAELTLSASPDYGSGAQYIWTGNNLPPFAPTVQTVTLVPNTTGNLEYTFAAVVNGCTTSVATVIIPVEAIPPVDITIDGNTECVDGTTTVTLIPNSTGATDWTWTNQAGTVVGTNENLVFNNATSANSGTYTVVVSNSLGCTASGSTTLTITDALPAIEAILTQPACEGGVLSLSTTLISGATYEWKGPGGTIALIPDPVIPNASPAMNGNYTV
ncbi:MAG: immunoglobulin domain-containing protein, partial [Gammaproteobacteria bacterium]